MTMVSESIKPNALKLHLRCRCCQADDTATVWRTPRVSTNDQAVRVALKSLVVTCPVCDAHAATLIGYTTAWEADYASADA